MLSHDYETPLLSPNSPLDTKSKDLIRDLVKKEKIKAKALPTDDPLDPKRQKRVEYTGDELWEQPEVIRRNLSSNKDSILQLAGQLAKKRFDRIYMTGCGDSVASMIAVRSLWETLLEIPCEPVQALDFSYYYHRPINEKTLVITLSSSGTTPRTVEAMLLARALGATTLCLSNTAGSALMSESDQGILIDAERKGWPTQSSTAAMALLFLLGIAFAQSLDRNTVLAKTYQAELAQIPEVIEAIIKNTEMPMQRIAIQEAKKSIYLFSGGGPAYASALIGAAKVKECSPDHAIAIPLEEFHHYNSQKAGDPLFIISPKGHCVPRAIDTAIEGRRWGGRIYSVVTESLTNFGELSDETIFLPNIDETLSPLIFTIPVQLFAYQVAMEKFRLAEQQNK